MKELNEKLILTIAGGLLIIGLGFYFLFPSENNVEAKVPSSIKPYQTIDIPEAAAVNADWPKAKEQAKGEMFDLFTPPEIYINGRGEFVFRPPYYVTSADPLGIHLLDIKMNPYRFQLEGFVEEDRDDQSRTLILVHSVEDGRSLRLSPGDSDAEYGFNLLDWRVERNFDDEENTQLIAWLKLEDVASNRIVNLRHDQSYYEDKIEAVFGVDGSNESFVLSDANTRFTVENIEYQLDAIDYENRTASVTKLIPDNDSITQMLTITSPAEAKADAELKEEESSKDTTSIEDAIRSFF
jgi:hypothetical protein